MTIEAVLFDVAGVLLIPHAQPVVETLTKSGIDADWGDFERAHYVGVAAIEELPYDRAPRPPYLEVFAAEIGVPEVRQHVAAQLLLDLWDRDPISVFRQLCRGVPAGLEALVESNVRCAIVSNSDGTVESQLLAHRVCQVGDGPGVPVCAIIDSHVAGVSKPDRGIFELGLAAVGSEPDSAVYVGDSVRYDIEGAQGAGMSALHFDPFGFCRRGGHDHVGSLHDVVEWVSAQRG